MTNTEMPDEIYVQLGENRIGTEICLRKWSEKPFEDGTKYVRADKAAPVERIEGALEKLSRQFSIQNLSSEMDDEALERADFQSAYDMFINKTRAYLKLQGGE